MKVIRRTLPDFPNLFIKISSSQKWRWVLDYCKVNPRASQERKRRSRWRNDSTTQALIITLDFSESLLTNKAFLKLWIFKGHKDENQVCRAQTTTHWGKPPQFVQKFTFSKSHFSQNSHFQGLIFQKIHIFKVAFFTKFTILKSHFSQNSHFKSVIFHKIHIFQTWNYW